jgi:indole-3-glycerol phosphate synthase
MIKGLLRQIVAEKEKEIRRLRANQREINGDQPPGPIRDFKGAISKTEGINLIAEIKFASPSAGNIRERRDPITIGRIYEEAGASAISLLTDKEFFQGDLTDLPRLKKAVSLPILRKDFILDEVQVRESFLWGADAILLISRLLSNKQLKGLLGTCRELGLAALTEVHDRDDLEKAVECGADIIGINNRNLKTFEVNIKTTTELAPLARGKQILVSESGIRNGEDINLLRGYGVRAVLVGTTIMKSDNMMEKVRELVGAGRNK